MKEETRSAMAEMQAKERKKRMMRALSQARQELMREIREKEKLVKNSRGRTAGKRRMRTAADAMSAQERMALNGCVRVYQLGRPMTRRKFLALPEDLRRVYVKLLRDKHGATRQQVRQMTGEDYGLRFGEGDARKWEAFLARGRR